MTHIFWLRLSVLEVDGFRNTETLVTEAEGQSVNKKAAEVEVVRKAEITAGWTGHYLKNTNEHEGNLSVKKTIEQLK